MKRPFDTKRELFYFTMGYLTGAITMILIASWEIFKIYN